ncbi:hypothetical protein B0H19DRAFT_1243322 [Mycena capillaripes]|nr:hypothetical protein B0H19DRAFT_1243322 [Mycena capillaripes]
MRTTIYACAPLEASTLKEKARSRDADSAFPRCDGEHRECTLPAGAVRLRHALHPAHANQLQCTPTSEHTTHGRDIEAEAMHECHISARTSTVRGILLQPGSVLVALPPLPTASSSAWTRRADMHSILDPRGKKRKQKVEGKRKIGATATPSVRFSPSASASGAGKTHSDAANLGGREKTFGSVTPAARAGTRTIELALSTGLTLPPFPPKPKDRKRHQPSGGCVKDSVRRRDAFTRAEGGVREEHPVVSASTTCHANSFPA